MTEANIQKLINFISQRRTFNQVGEKAFSIDPNWREGTWTRSLRKHKEIKRIGKDETKPVDENNPVVAYEPINPLRNAHSIADRQIDLNKFFPPKKTQEPLLKIDRTWG
jgi:hypothetical protein